MKRLLYIAFFTFFLLLWSSCRKDFDFAPSSGNLQFSKTTVYLDTIFANIGSSTYNLKVYNRSSDDISIPTIRLANGETSGYRLNVDGMPGKSFENVELLAKDSLFIFIETTFDTSQNPLPDTEFLYTDQILFDIGVNQQQVELVTLVKDAIFIFPDRDANNIIETLTLNVNGDVLETDIQGRELDATELTFTNEKPYVIYGYAAVPNGQTLTINAGARVHFHANSGILVSENATLNVNGAFSPDQETLDNEVIFEGDRLEPRFSDVAGQWGTIWFFENSVNNSINYATIKNATVAILSDENPDAVTNKLTITNTQIYNSSNFGILGRNTSIRAENLVINNSGQSSFAATFGGKYNVTHSTIGNYWTNSSRQLPSLLINNFLETDTSIFLSDLTEANFNNCIIYGNDTAEFIVDEQQDNSNSVAFNFKFTNCLIKFPINDTSFAGANYIFSNTALYEGNIYNFEPQFKNTEKNQLLISTTSPAINEGNSTFASQVPQDILTNNRTVSPDLGAYQNSEF
jgi:hypothetical protein